MQRSGFLVWHRRLALLFAPLLLLQALTGAALVFQQPLSALTGPRGSDGAPLPVSALVAAAQRDGARLDRLFLPLAAGEPALAQRTALDGKKSYAALDASNGRILREGGVFAFPFEAALQWHYRLMWGTTGLALVALNGLVLIILAGSGIGFWWPAKGRWTRKVLAINPKMPARVRLRQWHRSGGVVVAVLIGLSGVTGVLLSAPDVFVGGAPAALDYPATGTQIDAAVSAAQAQFPGAAIRDIRFPHADRLDINFRADDHGPRSVHVVSVQLSSTQVTKVLPAARNEALWMKVLPLHTGESFGLFGRLLLLVEALVLAALAITGPMMWWQQRKLRE